MASKRKTGWIEGFWQSGAPLIGIILGIIFYLETKSLKVVLATLGVALFFGMYQAWRFRTGKDGLV